MGYNLWTKFHCKQRIVFFFNEVNLFAHVFLWVMCGQIFSVISLKKLDLFKTVRASHNNVHLNYSSSIYVTDEKI